MTQDDVWKLQDAKARFSELVRRARSGGPQRVTVHGKDAVLVVDPERYEVQAKTPRVATLADFVKRSRKYRLDVDIEFDRPLPMDFPAPRVPGSGGRSR
jgi:prevent-host-death family protein